MGFQIYRFEVLDEIGRTGSNVIYEARDTTDSTATRLYEWTPSPGEAKAAAETLHRVAAEMDGIEVFAAGHRLYVAAPKQRAQRSLELLRTYKLFPGVWPGLFEDDLSTAGTKLANPKLPDLNPRSVRLKSRRRLVWLAVLLLVAGMAMVAGWWWGENFQSSQTSDLPMPKDHAIAPATKPVQIKYFNLEPELVQPGQTVTLSWEVVDAKEVWLRGLGQLPILVQHVGAQSFSLPHNAQQIELEAIGEGPNNSATAVRPLHFARPAPN